MPKKPPGTPASRRKAASTEISPDRLRWRCTPAMLHIGDLADVEPSRRIIGQDRALQAIQVGLEMKHYGYNIFVTGLPGTGRMTAIRRMLHEFEGRKIPLTDKVYVHNFRNPDAPILLSFPAGQGMAFKHEMAAFLDDLQKSIPAVFESRRYIEQRKGMLEHFQDRQRIVLKDFEKKVKGKGFEVVQVQGGAANRPEIAPVIDGSPVGLDQLQAKVDAGELSQDELKRLTAEQAELEGQMDIVMREMRNIERRAKKSLDDLNHKIMVPVVEELLDEVRAKFKSEGLEAYLGEVRKSILDNLARFHQKEEQAASVLGMQISREEDTFFEFEVNVIADNSGVQGAPVVLEKNPRYKNLFGTIDREVDRNGVWRSDFTLIKAGSVLKADGGYLVLNALDALSEPGVWNTLKRILRNRQIEIQPPESGFLGSSSALKPQAIDLDVKVIMIGDSPMYQLLYEYDEDFKKIFKIRADFDTEMLNDEKSIASYLSFIKTLSDREQLIPFDTSALCEVVEYGVRLAGRQNKLSTRFSILADVLREASYWAGREKSARVGGDHVRRAIDERIERVRLVEEKIQEMIDDGSIMIATDGKVMGQVNGLSVYQTGEHEFGKPARITAKTAVGRSGIINIEREASMSGPSHNKGVLILGGYFRGKYAQKHPLELSASLAFEQSYSGVDGDSASSSEVYALLSSLSGVPIDQAFAVTGSVNQHGEIQPIGGVNLKIEGFFDCCKARGLNGRQGVIIPHQNVADLMLRHDVIEAVRKNLFRVHAIRTIDEGIAILTGVPAAKIHAKVAAKLKEYSRTQKKSA
ncbi:MAG TPA: ATP-binding protein [Bacteroidota bacterium]|nr:ATP-binding protein [Bacteroidota bacterium]